MYIRPFGLIPAGRCRNRGRFWRFFTMDTLKLILLIFQMISCVVLTVVIILQNGAEDGLGAIAGGSDT